MSWIWLIASIISEVIGTLSLRATDGFRKQRWLIPVFIGYGLAFTFLALALTAGMSIAVAYGIWTAVGIALIALVARVIWNDPLTKKMLAGIALIVVGVILVETT